jgi:hypothetical protein
LHTSCFLECGDEYECQSLGGCIPRSKFCDGHLDCGYGEDEAVCSGKQPLIVDFLNMHQLILIPWVGYNPYQLLLNQIGFLQIVLAILIRSGMWYSDSMYCSLVCVS